MEKNSGREAGHLGGQAPREQEHMVRVAAEQLMLVDIGQLIPYANNAKRHGNEQIRRLRASLREFGFVTPVLIDSDYNIIAGHGRVLAAQAEKMREVPCVMVSKLTEAQRKAFILADNRLSETGEWDLDLLGIEIEGLRAMEFDTDLIGFDEAFFPEQAPSCDADGGKHFWGDQEGVGNEEYDQFVAKFAPKLTTDDCYTPPAVYEAVKAWAVKEYGLEEMAVTRPFYPGGDYQNEEYPEGCVVIDNPPFSILSEICRYYRAAGVKFFLFAPALTLFSVGAGEFNYLPLGVDVIYENGANVATSFVTNLGPYRIDTAPDLYRMATQAVAESRNMGPGNPGYIYPDEVVTASTIMKYCAGGADIKIKNVHFVRALDAQRAERKAIYGGGFLISKAAAEKAAAEKAAAEKAAAEKEKTVWALSPEEQAIVDSLPPG